MAQSGSSPASELEEATTANTYSLSCTDCSFEMTVEGDTYDALEISDAHQEKYGETLRDHFVNFQMEQ